MPMMSALHLIWIIPLSMLFGMLVSMVISAGTVDDLYNMVDWMSREIEDMKKEDQK